MGRITRVVPVHLCLTYRVGDPAFTAIAGELIRGVLRSMAGMESCSRPDSALCARHPQGLNDQSGAHVLGDLPANNHARAQTELLWPDATSLASAQVSGVADRHSSRRIRARVEAAFQPLDECRGLLICDGGALVNAFLGVRPRYSRAATTTHQRGKRLPAS